MKKYSWIIFLLFIFFLCSCATNNKRLPNPPKYLTLTVLSGTIRVHVQGEVTVMQNYLSDGNRVTKDYTFSPRDDYGIIPRGTRTIDDILTLSEEDTWTYSLQSGETITLVFSSITDQGKFNVSSRSITKQYSISTLDKLNLMLCFSN